MRVAIDCTSLLDPHRTGVGNMVDATVRALAAPDDESARAKRSEPLELTGFAVSVRGRGRLGATLPPGVAVVDPPIPARLAHWAWQRWSRPRIDRLLGRPDVVHGPNFVVPPARAATVVTVHDLTTLHSPELCHPSTLGFPRQIQRAIDDGAWVHTVSHAVADEVVDAFDVAPERVVAIPNGYTPTRVGDADAGRSLAGHDAFVLAVGTVEPRKNLPLLVDAIGALARRGRQIPLIHVGPDGWGTDAFDAAVARLPTDAVVRRLGHRSASDLADLYAAARLFAFPSRYEGFGLPVLEAMDAGVPVVCSAVPALHEVGGDAVTIVPGANPDTWAEAIDSLWADHQRRQRSIDAGRAHVGRYRWADTAAGLRDLYAQAARG